jgi:Ni/Co efflux regulator RcnB
MLRALVIAAMLALLLPGLALAQQQKDEHKGPPPPHPSGGGGGPPHPQLKPAFVPHPGPPGPSGGSPHPELKPAFVPHPGPPGPPAAFAHPGGPQFTYRGRPFNRVHVHPFFYPQGWAYRQWAIGAILPPLFLSPDYYYADWAALGLDPPPPGDEWVRYGPDLLLVDTTTGQVVDVIYGVFYED